MRQMTDSIPWCRLLLPLLAALCLSAVVRPAAAYSGKIKESTRYQKNARRPHAPAPVVIQYATQNAAVLSTAISANSFFAISLNQQNQVYFTGANNSGQFGNGSTSLGNNNVWAPGPTGIQAIAAGEAQTLLLTGAGDPLGAGHIRGAGLNDDGDLGNGTTTNALTFTLALSDPASPLAGAALSGIVQIAAGREHGIALDSSNRIWVVGDNDHGQLGINACPMPSATCTLGQLSIHAWQVTQTGLPAGGQVLSVGAGGDFSLALVYNPTTGKNELYGTGWNVLGQFGLGDQTDRYQWTEIAADVMTPQDGPTFAAGWWHIVYIDSAGTLHAAGDNSCGQLGYGPGDPACETSFPDSPANPGTVPTQQYSTAFVTPLPAGMWIAQVGAAPYASFAILGNGDLYAAGANMNGQLGVGNVNAYQTSFVPVLDNVDSVVGGRYFSLALRDGDMYYSGGDNLGTSFAGNPQSDTWQLAQ